MKIAPHHRIYLVASFVSAAVALLCVLKVFLVKDCWSFDLADDANHTFPNLFVARQALRAGLLPEINFFNNFGSPLLGDALTYPFAVHSLTYWIWDGPVAMTINRALFAALTIVLGFSFYRTRVSARASLVCSLSVFFAAVSLWYFATYHMQLALFFEFGILILGERFDRGRSRAQLMGLTLTMVIMILSLSINLSVFIIGFSLAAQVIRDRCKPTAAWLGQGAAVASATVATFFQTGAFARAMAQGTRLYTHYDERGAYAPGKLISRIFNYVPAESQRWHTDATVFLSWPFVLLSVTGVLLLHRRHSKDANVATFLGSAPILLSYVLMTLPSVWWIIPLIKSTDLTRIVWLSLPFLTLALGAAVDEITNLSASRRGEVFAGLCAVLISAQGVPITRILGLGDCKVCRNTHYYSLRSEARLRPEGVGKLIAPGSRFTFEEPTVTGNDFRGAYFGAFGTYQRSITSDQRLFRYLNERGLIDVEPDPNKTYHFRAPWTPDEFEALGLRYLVLPRAMTDASSDWTPLGPTDGKYIYEHARRPSPIYVVTFDTIRPVYSFAVNPNQIAVDLPPATGSGKLIATFSHSSAYRASVDGQPAEARLTEGPPFIEVSFPAGARKVTLQYQTVRWREILANVAWAVFILSVGLWLIDRFRFRDRLAKI